MGLGGSVSTTDIIFEKNTYYPGEQVRVKVICDNSQCTTGIKSFKIKLKRKVFAAGSRVSAFAERDDLIIKSSKYLYQFKDTNTGCGPNKTVERTLSFNIPTEDPDLPADETDKLKLSKDDQ